VKNKRTKTFLIVIALLAVAVVLYALLGPGGGVDTPPVVLPTALGGAPSPEGGDSQGSTAALAEVKPSTVQAVVERLSRAESYSRTVTVTDYWQGGESRQTLAEWVNGGSRRIRGADGKNILLPADGDALVWYDDDSGIYSGQRAVDDADQWLRCLTYEELLEKPVSDIQDAGYTELNGEMCIYASYRSGAFGYENTVYVSVSTGLLMGAETRDGDTLVYAMESGTPTLSQPEDDYFKSPAPLK
jgi:outer membrane lipoprotein-sorting protein